VDFGWTAASSTDAGVTLCENELPARPEPNFAEQIRRALPPTDRFAETVRVTMLIGRKGGSRTWPGASGQTV
jgi:hypothetical protein